ncbi:hypothetical protein Q7O_002263 [Pectobacterium carotovorum subsp. carotovorum PCCS1]|nr:hypothetical protein [Pectobacterium carotovorum subsp. carotovorum PCCS1]
MGDGNEMAQSGEQIEGVSVADLALLSRRAERKSMAKNSGASVLLPHRISFNDESIVAAN